MNYNFDEIINRNGTDSVKWDAVERRWGRNDLIPMWVADMDFRTAPFVIDALKKRLEHEVLGYTFACKEWAESIINWLKERHGWEIREDMLTFTPRHCPRTGICHPLFHGERRQGDGHASCLPSFLSRDAEERT